MGLNLKLNALSINVHLKDRIISAASCSTSCHCSRVPDNTFDHSHCTSWRLGDPKWPRSSHAVWAASRLFSINLTSLQKFLRLIGRMGVGPLLQASRAPFHLPCLPNSAQPPPRPAQNPRPPCGLASPRKPPGCPRAGTITLSKEQREEMEGARCPGSSAPLPSGYEAEKLLRT